MRNLLIILLSLSAHLCSAQNCDTVMKQVSDVLTLKLEYERAVFENGVDIQEKRKEYVAGVKKIKENKDTQACIKTEKYLDKYYGDLKYRLAYRFNSRLSSVRLPCAYVGTPELAQILRISLNKEDADTLLNCSDRPPVTPANKP